MPQVKKPPCLIHFLISSLPSSLWGNKKWEPHFKDEEQAFEWIPFLMFSLPSSLWGNNKWEPHYKDEEIGKNLGQNQLNRLQMVQFECPRYWNNCVSFTAERIPFLIFSSGVIRIGLPSKNMRKLDFFDKISFTGSKCSSLNAPGKETPVSHSLLSESLFSYSASLPLSGVIGNGSSSIKMRKS